MSKGTIAICDTDQGYVNQLMDFLEDQGKLHFEFYGFTDVDKLMSFHKGHEKIFDLLIVAEHCYEKAVDYLAQKVIVLNEGMGKKIESAEAINKYQAVRNIYKAIMGFFLEAEAEIPLMLEHKTTARLLGFYSPVKRAMQTTFALELGKSLARRYKVLYINFEHYAGWNDLLCREGGKDLTDLIYYLKEEGERFSCRLRLVEQRLGDLFYIPPAYVGHHLVYVTVKDWITMLERVRTMGGYDFVLLDLSDSLQGIFEILRKCERIFTVAKADGPAMDKIKHYEYLLKTYEYEDVLKKSKIMQTPEFERLPEGMEKWTKENWRALIQHIERDELGLKENDL